MWEPEALDKSSENIVSNLRRLANLGKQHECDNEDKKVYKTYIPCTVEDTVTTAMIDTGNTFHSVMSEKLAKAIGVDVNNLRRIPGKDRVGTAGEGEELEVLGQVRKRLTMRLTAHTRPLYIRPMIVKGLSMNLNLSGPWMSANKMKIDPGKSLMYDGKAIPLISRNHIQESASVQHACCNLYTDKDLVIGPKSVVHAPVVVPPRMQEQYTNERIVVMGNQKVEQKHKVKTFQRTLVKLHTEGDRLKCKVGYRNDSNKAIKIPKGTCYGQGFPTTNEAGLEKQPWKICVYEDGRLAEKTRGRSRQKSSEPKPRDKPPERQQTDGVIKAQHAQFDKEGQTKKLDEWMEGPTNRSNFDQRCEHLRKTFKLDENENLETQSEKQQVLMVLLNFWENFSWDGRIGRTHLINHHLTLKAGVKPVRQKVRPIHPALEPSLQQQLLKWLRNNIIEPTDSSWNSNLLACYKPGGDVRWVVDFTSLNRVCEVDVFPVGDVQSNLTRLSKAKLYSLIDSQGAYHVIPIHPEDRYKTAFITPYNTYHFKYMPFGMAAAGATFCRLNQLIMGKAGITGDQALAYIDDLLVLGADFRSHLKNLFKTMKAYADAGILLNPQKCEFFKKEAKYLGYLISPSGTQPLPDYVKAVATWELPTNRHQLRVFLGKTNYYKRFLRNHAIIAKPLTDALKKDGEYAHLSDTDEYKPNDAYKEAFEKLKAALVEAPQLTHPRFDNLVQEPFVLDTDWAEDTLCIASALHQRQIEVINGKKKLIERPIAFMSKKLGEAAKSYSPMKGELAAVLHYLDYFAFYATVGRIVIRTDHQALLALRNSTETRGQWARWRTRLGTYNYCIEHRKGKDNQNADSLSRASHVKYAEDEDVDIFNEAEDGVQIVAIERIAINRFGEDIVSTLADSQGLAGLEQLEGAITITDMRNAQDRDEALTEVRRMLQDNEYPSRDTTVTASNELREWLDVYDQLYVSKDGLIRYSTRLSRDDGESWQEHNLVALPEDAAYDVAKCIHRYYSHIGFRNTFDKTLEKIWCQRLRKTVQRVCDECTQCQLKGGKKTDQRHTYYPIRQGAAWDVLNLDFCGPWPRTKEGYEFVLTIEDIFTRWIEAIPVKKQDSKSVCEALVTRFFPIFGLPNAIKTDNGSPFVAKIVEDLADMLQIDTRRSIPYNPAANPVERQHLNIKRALTAICKNKVTTWNQHLPTILFSLRVAKNRITNLSPYQMVFGSLPRTRLEHIFGDPPGQQFYNNRHEYVEALKHRIQVAHQWARKNISNAVARTRLQYNKTKNIYEVGDKVWLFSPRVSRTGQRRTFKSVWSGPWTIIKKLSDVSYEIKPHPTWARQGTVFVSINRLKRFICSDEDKDTPGYPPAIDQDIIMAGDEAAEEFVDEEHESDEESLEENGPEDIQDPDNDFVNEQFWIDDDYDGQENIEAETSENSSTEDDDEEPQQAGRQLRHRPRVDYHQLHHQGRPEVDALETPSFDRKGRIKIDTALLEERNSSEPNDLQHLTDQTKVLDRRNEASQRHLQRFAHSKQPR